LAGQHRGRARQCHHRQPRQWRERGAGLRPATGHLTGITSSSATAGTIQNLSYSFDTLGNLLSRTDSKQAIAESFVYDNLNRVTSSTVRPSGQTTGRTAINVAYDALGNITSKSDIGAYTYGPGTTCTNVFAGPHAVSSVAGTKNANYCYDNVGNLTVSVRPGPQGYQGKCGS
jgi:YD repeat-containing protein